MEAEGGKGGVEGGPRVCADGRQLLLHQLRVVRVQGQRAAHGRVPVIEQAGGRVLVQEAGVGVGGGRGGGEGEGEEEGGEGSLDEVV